MLPPAQSRLLSAYLHTTAHPSPSLTSQHPVLCPLNHAHFPESSLLIHILCAQCGRTPPPVPSPGILLVLQAQPRSRLLCETLGEWNASPMFSHCPRLPISPPGIKLTSLSSLLALAVHRAARFLPSRCSMHTHSMEWMEHSGKELELF